MLQQHRRHELSLGFPNDRLGPDKNELMIFYGSLILVHYFCDHLYTIYSFLSVYTMFVNQLESGTLVDTKRS